MRVSVTGRSPKATTMSPDRKSTRLNSSHMSISYAVFCLKKKKIKVTVRSFHATFPLECVADEVNTIENRVAVTGVERSGVVSVEAPLGVRCFFFYGYGDHRDLHSFPTRRSSDLAGLAVTPAGGDVLYVEAQLLPGGKGLTDRKSTRLNSSHMSISYAVLCLKK